MSVFSTLVTFTGPQEMSDFQLKDFPSDTESQYGASSATKKLVGQLGDRGSNMHVLKPQTELFMRMKVKLSPPLPNQD